MKIAINRDWGGFGVSEAIYKELGLEWDGYGYIGNEDLGIKDNNPLAYRTSPQFIAAIEKIGATKASGQHACLSIEEIPDDTNWYIDDYDGVETIHEGHRQWP